MFFLCHHQIKTYTIYFDVFLSFSPLCNILVVGIQTKSSCPNIDPKVSLENHCMSKFLFPALHVKENLFFSCQPYNHLNRLVCPPLIAPKKISLIRVVAILWLPRNTWKQNLLEGMLQTIENCLISIGVPCSF